MKVSTEDELVFDTESGARYWIRKGKVKRLNPDDVKRGDGEWLKMWQMPVIEVGYPVTLKIDHLRDYGPDDYGSAYEDTIGSGFTTRLTTPVVGVERYADE